MNERTKKVIFGVGIAIATYLIFMQLSKKYFEEKQAEKSQDEEQNDFVGFSKESSEYYATYYDPNHVNEDGSQGATWIGFNKSAIVGFWKKGKFQQGAKINP